MKSPQNSRRDCTWDRLYGLLTDGGATPNELVLFAEAVSRRQFFKHVGKSGAVLPLLATFGAGSSAALQGLFGRGLLPVAWADDDDLLADKPGMVVHSPHPVNGEFPPHLLNDNVTPSARHFVRNNGVIPARAKNKDVQEWKLVVDGEVQTPLALSLDDVKKLPAVTLQVVVECGGNGRALFEPAVRGNPWTWGAVGCSEWTGVRLRDVLQMAGLKSSAVYTAHYGEDLALGKAEPFSRGIPIDKAMEEHTLVAYSMNGTELPALHGYPVRVVVPGWIGSCSQKWLNRIWVRDRIHDAQKMTGYSYRVPAYPVEPGSRPPESDMVITTAWVIKSMITQPEAGQRCQILAPLKVRGHAWAGENTVAKVLVSTDFGIHWQEATLAQPANRYAWSRWETELTFRNRGYYEIWARAFDDKGSAQPFRQPWNPKGYLGNVIHRVPVTITA